METALRRQNYPFAICSLPCPCCSNHLPLFLTAPLQRWQQVPEAAGSGLHFFSLLLKVASMIPFKVPVKLADVLFAWAKTPALVAPLSSPRRPFLGTTTSPQSSQLHRTLLSTSPSPRITICLSQSGLYTHYSKIHSTSFNSLY